MKSQLCSGFHKDLLQESPDLTDRRRVPCGGQAEVCEQVASREDRHTVTSGHTQGSWRWHRAHADPYGMQRTQEHRGIDCNQLCNLDLVQEDPEREAQEPKVSWSVAVENLVIKKLHKIHCILVFTSLRSPEVSDITAESGVIRGTQSQFSYDVRGAGIAYYSSMERSKRRTNLVEKQSNCSCLNNLSSLQEKQ